MSFFYLWRELKWNLLFFLSWKHTAPHQNILSLLNNLAGHGLYFCMWFHYRGVYSCINLSYISQQQPEFWPPSVVFFRLDHRHLSLFVALNQIKSTISCQQSSLCLSFLCGNDFLHVCFQYFLTWKTEQDVDSSNLIVPQLQISLYSNNRSGMMKVWKIRREKHNITDRSWEAQQVWGENRRPHSISFHTTEHVLCEQAASNNNGSKCWV